MKNYAMYLRKSRADVELESIDKFETLSRHEHILNELADKKGLNVVKVYKELVSGESIDSRPQMQELLNDLWEDKYDGVLVVEVERLARGDTKDQGTVAEAFKQTNTLIITPTKTYDPNNEFDEEYFEFGLFMSRREYKTIRRRMQRGRDEALANGCFLADAPYGYDIYKIDKKTRTLKANEDAENVKLIFDLYANQNMTPYAIRTRLQELGIKSPAGSEEWNRDSVRRILQNPTYTGKIIHRKTEYNYVVDPVTGKRTKKRCRTSNSNIMLYEGKHKAIIDDETFHRAQARFKTAPKTKGKCSLRNPYASILHCSKCGITMSIKQDNNKRLRIGHPDGRNCKCASVYMETLNNAFIGWLENEVLDFEVKLNNESLQKEVVNVSDQVRKAEANLKKLEKKKTNLFDFFEDGTYTREEFLTRKEKVLNQIQETQATIQKLKEYTPSTEIYEQQIITFKEACKLMKNEQVPADVKNQFLKTFIERIDYSVEKESIHSEPCMTFDVYFLS